MPRTQAGSLPVHYLAQGPGPPVAVLLHAALGSSRQWRSVMAALPPSLRVIAPDLRGHGLSGKPEHGSAPHAMASDLRAFLDALDIPRAFLVGLSLGGRVALQFAIEQPERVQGLVIVGAASVGPSPARSPLWLRWAQRARQDEVALRQFVSSVFAHPPSEEELALLMADARQASDQAWFGAQANPPPQDLAEVVPGLPVPTLIVHGGRDRVVPTDTSRALHALIPGSELVIWAEHGHFLPQEAPVRFARLVTSFIEHQGSP